MQQPLVFDLTTSLSALAAGLSFVAVRHPLFGSLQIQEGKFVEIGAVVIRYKKMNVTALVTDSHSQDVSLSAGSRSPQEIRCTGGALLFPHSKGLSSNLGRV